MKMINDVYNNVIDEEQLTSSSIKLSGGNTLIIDNKKEEIKIVNRQVVQLIISLKEDGLTVSVNASKLNINAEKELNLSSKKINISATDQINIKTNGNLVNEVGKDCLTEIEGTNKSIAQIQKITASLGSVIIKANDDVRLDGERVKLNCD